MLVVARPNPDWSYTEFHPKIPHIELARILCPFLPPRRISLVHSVTLRQKSALRIISEKKCMSVRQKFKITGTWAPRQVLTKQQGLDQMCVRLKSRDYPAGQYDLTQGYGAFRKTRFRFPLKFSEGSVAGDSTPA